MRRGMVAAMLRRWVGDGRRLGEEGKRGSLYRAAVDSVQDGRVVKIFR